MRLELEHMLGLYGEPDLKLRASDKASFIYYWFKPMKARSRDGYSRELALRDGKLCWLNEEGWHFYAMPEAHSAYESWLARLILGPSCEEVQGGA